VEALDYASAHRLAAVMVGFSLVVLLLLYGWRPLRQRIRGADGA